MQLKSLFTTLGLCLGLGISTAHANIVLHSAFSVDDVCANAGGLWKGMGNATAAGIKCKYRGEVVATPTYQYGYKLNINLYRVSGRFCPESETLDLAGVCENGKFAVKSDEADLTGTTDGRSASLRGTIILPVNNIPVKATVDMELEKQ